MLGSEYLRQTRPPSEAGTYGLLLSLPQCRKIQIGKFGEFIFPTGHYIYLGSALGAGGLRARINRHLCQDKRAHWHIDWLMVECAVIGYWYVISKLRLECLWAKALIEIPEISIPAPGFGASDCRENPACSTHLVYSRPEIEIYMMSNYLASAVTLPIDVCCI